MILIVELNISMISIEIMRIINLLMFYIYIFLITIAPDDKAPLLGWMQSPLDTFDCFSPDQSKMSYNTLSSPPFNMPTQTGHHQPQILEAIGNNSSRNDHLDHLDNTCFSPSMFSPMTVDEYYMKSTTNYKTIMDHHHQSAIDQLSNNHDSFDPSNALSMLVYTTYHSCYVICSYVCMYSSAIYQSLIDVLCIYLRC